MTPYPKWLIAFGWVTDVITAIVLLSKAVTGEYDVWFGALAVFLLTSIVNRSIFPRLYRWKR